MILKVLIKINQKKRIYIKSRINQKDILIQVKIFKRRKLTDNYSLISFSENKQINERDYKLFFDEYFATSLDDIEYDEAINKDKRTFCQYFRECLKKKQMIAFTFIANNPLKIRIIKIMVFILNIVLYLFQEILINSFIQLWLVLLLAI